MAATRLGDHRFDDRLDDLSAEARAGRRRTRPKQFLADLPRRGRPRRPLARRPDRLRDLPRTTSTRSIWLAENFRPVRGRPPGLRRLRRPRASICCSPSRPCPEDEHPRTPSPGWARSPASSPPPARRSAGPPRVKVETAILQTEGAIGFYKDDLFLLADRPKGEGELGRAGRRRSSRALEITWGSSRTRSCPAPATTGGSAPSCSPKKLELELDAGLSADEVLAEAESEAARVETRDGRHRPPALGRLFPRRAGPARRRRRPPRR